ncbi:hypothetical protein THASP1DRAFT_26222 [Thamnocephalis sphaerospora]|uniref:Uncharacterized protein n=1 Tax=Thamnocephalis sphaerospora TaxID=78915 RepID=A0A4P9XJ82_9FUNG|nr:hypothetical protein THASP1DRAFT_26222 [Thamnocephalis sphaerospora]|eukprot:RKP05250.1 hypothetical protein THASP1DRAFT_26222 [Thamnocephalis sphaerospora]
MGHVPEEAEKHGPTFTIKFRPRSSLGRNVDQDSLPGYAVAMLEKLKQARICSDANAWRNDHEEFNNERYTQGPTRFRDDGELEPIYGSQRELEPFYADRRELEAVNSQMELICNDNFQGCMWSEYDIRVLVHANLMETKLRLTQDKHRGLFATSRPLDDPLREVVD